MPLKPHGVEHRAIAALLSLFLLAVLALMSAAYPAQAQVEVTAAQAQHAGSGKTMYRVINLSDGEHFGDVAINASGQVAFSHTGDTFQAPVAAFFYDGASIRNIGRLGNDYAIVDGLNNSGQVVGRSINAAGLDRTFIWSARRAMADIGALPGAGYMGRAVINNNGVVAGFMNTTSGNRSYRWSRTDGLIDLGTLRPSESGSTVASALNDAGVIVGSSPVGNNGFHAFRWTFGSGMVDIHGIDATSSVAVGVDAAGNVAGNYADVRLGDGKRRAFLWTPGRGMRPLTYGANDLQITGITASGRVFGGLSDAAGNYRAFSWTRAGGVNDLGTLGGAYSAPNGANNNGQVIGASDDASGQLRPFVWSAGVGMLDLSKRLRHVPPSLSLETPLAISDNGAIVARANTGLVLLKPMNGAPCTCPHTVGPVLGADVTPVGATFEAAVGVGSDKPGARYRIEWSWGDGAGVNIPAEDMAGTVVVTPAGARVAAIYRGTGVVTSSARHIYTTPGAYTVSANVVDAGSGASVRVSRKIVVQPAHGAAGNKVAM